MTIDSNGRVGIGTTNPVSPLTVNGVIESKSGGIKFPDGSVQMTSANSTTTAIMKSKGILVCDDTARDLDTFTFSGTSGQRVIITVTHKGRLSTTGYQYNDLYLDGVKVDTGGAYGNNGWRMSVTTNYVGILSYSGTHTILVKYYCGGATSFSDLGGEWPNGGLTYIIDVGP